MNNDINVQDHFGLGAWIARKYADLKPGQLLEETDEWADGMVGLTNAWIGHDPSMGYKFSTFAYYCIRNEILRNKTYRDRHRIHTVSLDAEVTKDKDHRSTLRLHDFYPVPDRGMEQVDAEDFTKSCFRNFDDRMKFILRRRLMDDLTLHEVGKEVGLVRERVRQIEKKGLEKLRRYCERTHVSC